jgi:hypothetical protein
VTLAGDRPTPGPAVPATPSPAATYGLRPRPDPDPAIVAVLAAAVDAVWPDAAQPPVGDDAANPAHKAWRFSGRWWSRPVAARRDRPWVG